MGLYGPNHPEVAAAISNLAGALRVLGDIEGARSYYERALAIDEAAYGPAHPTVAVRLNNLGSLFRETGDLYKARDLYERALKIFQNTLPENHQLIWKVHKNLQTMNGGSE